MFVPGCPDYLKLSLLESGNLNRDSGTYTKSVVRKRYVSKIHHKISIQIYKCSQYNHTSNAF